jgi:hypothetical protein
MLAPFSEITYLTVSAVSKNVRTMMRIEYHINSFRIGKMKFISGSLSSSTMNREHNYQPEESSAD